MDFVRGMVRLLFVLLIVSLLGVLTLVAAYAQSDGRMHQYMFNQLDFNPGFAGSQGKINLLALARQQWVGFGKGAPQTIFFNFDIPFAYRDLSRMKPGRKMQYSHGLGVHLMRDAIGFMSMNGVELSYAARFHLRALGHLGVGLGLRAVNDRFDATWRAVDNADSDPAIPLPKSSSIAFDLSFGIYFNTSQAYFGLSGQNLLGSELRDKLGAKLKQKARMDFTRQYYVVAGYNVALGQSWSVEPSILLRSDFVQHACGITSCVKYNNWIWMGVSYHVMESVGAMVGVDLFNGLKIGYSYDYPTSEIRHFTSGSHEVVLGYSFNMVRDKTPRLYRSIRFL